MNDILEKLKQLPKDKPIIVATSGGPDSMVILDMLINQHFNVICAHVNHNLRKESQKEAEMVKHYCQTKNIKFEYMIISNYKGNEEKYAREKRYEFFENLIKKYSSPLLITAHHGDDLIETIIMRLIRSSTLKGYAAFQEITDKGNYKIYRPLITKTKEEILKYAKENNIPYAIDKTNKSDKYTRNRIRNHILKVLKKENKSVHLKFLNFSKTIYETEQYLEEITQNKIKDIYIEGKIQIDMFLKEKPLIQKRIINRILSKTYKNEITKITENITKNILNLLKKPKPNQKLNLPNNKILIKAYNKAWIEENTPPKKYNIILKNKVKLNTGIIEIIKETKDTSNYVTKINSKEIKLPIHIRTKKDGDKLLLKGLNKHKKLKDIFIDEKIPKEKRDTYPIVTDDNDEIIWLPGLKKTKFDKSKSQNYDIIIRYKKKGSL